MNPYLAPHETRCRPSGSCVQSGTCGRALTQTPTRGGLTDYTLPSDFVSGQCAYYLAASKCVVPEAAKRPVFGPVKGR